MNSQHACGPGGTTPIAPMSPVESAFVQVGQTQQETNNLLKELESRLVLALSERNTKSTGDEAARAPGSTPMLEELASLRDRGNDLNGRLRDILERLVL